MVALFFGGSAEDSASHKQGKFFESSVFFHAEGEDGEFGGEWIGLWERTFAVLSEDIEMEYGILSVEREVGDGSACGARYGDSHIVCRHAFIFSNGNAVAKPLCKVIKECVVSESVDGRGRDRNKSAQDIGGDNLLECGGGGNEAPTAQDNQRDMVPVGGLGSERDEILRIISDAKQGYSGFGA